IDGAQHMEFSAGSGKNYYASAKWQLNLNGMYQLGHGFEVAANLFGRQGYPKPVYIQADTGPLDGVVNVLAVPTTDSIRLKSLWDMDLRLAKDLRLGGSTRLTLAGDLFNVFNSNTELYRNPSAGGSAYNPLGETLAARILPLGAERSFWSPLRCAGPGPKGPGPAVPLPMSRSRRRSSVPPRAPRPSESRGASVAWWRRRWSQVGLAVVLGAASTVAAATLH